ncbi:MAG: CRISPR-associated helicase Cas3' [Chloroflexota bacterium]|nr:CRISPR-associated helicase Cas3' [Chloroflexota bacterium]
MGDRVAGAPAYTRRFWAKADRQAPDRIHLLEHHLADVGACFEALLDQPTIRRRLARTACLDQLDDATAARLAVFAALHDIGKVNVGFQARIWRKTDIPMGQLIPCRTGHTADLVPVLDPYGDTETAAWFFPALGWVDDVLEWDDKGGVTACALFVAALSHHGEPLNLHDDRQRNPRVWRSFGKLDPHRYVARIGKLVREWFPAAFDSGAPPLPSEPAFQHMFLGLCNWADWIGSDEDWFPYCDRPDDNYIATARERAKRAVKSIGLNLSDQRNDFADVPGFGELFDIPGAPTPNAIQETAQRTPLDQQLVIIESETGSGKTEAALWRFAKMYERQLVDGLYFALPTRAAAVQLHRRVTSFILNMLSGDYQPEPVLAVPGYVRAGDFAGRHLPDYKVLWDDHPNDATRNRRWAAESAKRFLAAQIAVGTVDQAMLGALQVKNAHMRAACLARNLLVVDEVHASDTYMSVVLEQLLAAHLGAGGYALLMSATLGSAARLRWLFRPGRTNELPSLALNDAINTAYPAVTTLGDGREAVLAAGENDQHKEVQITARPEMHEFASVAQRALTAARAGAKVLVVRNTVDYAINIQEAIEELAGPADAGLLFTVCGKRTLHHGRFAAADRRLLDAEVERQLGKQRPAGGHIVVGTQTLEQSLDIDADLLITDLCPVDVLLQRIGRLHRHERHDRPPGYTTPACTVLTPPDNDLSPLLKSGQNANGLGPHGHVYGSLQILEATQRLIAEHPAWRIPEMNRELVEQATHPQALDDITQEMGEDWQAHALAIQGGDIGDGQTARGVTIRRNGSFFTDNRDVVFVSSDENIRTRLGDDRVDVALDPPQPSPFDGPQQIDKLAVSVRWLPPGREPEPVAPAPADDGFEFALGERRCRYDRRGLRRF